MHSQLSYLCAGISDRGSFFFASFSLHFLLHFRSKCNPYHCRFWVTFGLLLCHLWITLEHKVTASRSWALGARCEDYPSYWVCTFRQAGGDYLWCWTCRPLLGTGWSPVARDEAGVMRGSDMPLVKAKEIRCIYLLCTVSPCLNP